jgi:hypothetical protein
MPHSSEVRWDQAVQQVGDAAFGLLTSLQASEAIYQELLEVYNYAGGTDQLAANLLFNGDVTVVAVASDVSKLTDLKSAIQAMHDLWLALDNTALVAEDRGSALRRVS